MDTDDYLINNNINEERIVSGGGILSNLYYISDNLSFYYILSSCLLLYLYMVTQKKSVFKDAVEGTFIYIWLLITIFSPIIIYASNYTGPMVKFVIYGMLVSLLILAIIFIIF